MALLVPAHVAAAPSGDFEQSLAEADEHTRAGRHAEALRAYTAAFDGMTTELKASGVAQFAVVAAAEAAVLDYEARGHRESLEIARELLVEFIAGADAGADVDAEEAKQWLAKIEALIPAEEPGTSDGDSGALGADPTDSSDPEHQPRDGGASTGAPPRLTGLGKTGIALLVVGGTSIVAGGILMAIPRPELRIEPGELPRVRATREFGYGFLGGGVALAITGGVLFAVDRKRAKQSRAENVSVLPWYRANAAGIGMSGRF